MVIWDRKNLPPELAVSEVPGTIYGLSSKGWIDQELFDLWFIQHFLRYAPPIRPLLLLMDGHSSHYCPSTIKCAAKEKAILFTLPPNTTHLTQPLDKAVFGPLKVSWRQACHRYIVENPGSKISKHNFSLVFSEAWVRALTPKNIVSGFRTTGVYPPDRNAISLPSDQKQNLAAQSGVAYIPLYTPAKRRLSCSSSITAFAEEEMECFDTCFEEGTGDRDDSQYQAWLKMYYPEALSPVNSPLSAVYLPAVKHTSIGDFLDSPPPLPRYPGVVKSSLRVLTSSENLQRIEEKAKKKEAQLQEKEERARKREEKRLLKAQQKVPQSKGQVYFSEDKFKTRYENGYDLLTDDRYNLWVATYASSLVSTTPRGACNVHAQMYTCIQRT